MDMGKSERDDGEKAFSQWVVQQILPMFSYKCADGNKFNNLPYYPHI